MKTPKLILALAAAFCLAGCQEKIYHGLSEREANAMQAALASAGIAASRSAGANGSYDLEVSRGDQTAAILALDRAGFPQNAYESFEKVFPPGGLIEGPVEQKARYQYALAQELEHTLSQLLGVAAVRVHVALGEKDLRGVVVSAPGASVMARYRVGADLGVLGAQIKAIVAGAVDGAQTDRVLVVFTPESKGADEPAPAVRRSGLSADRGLAPADRLALGCRDEICGARRR